MEDNTAKWIARIILIILIISLIWLFKDKKVKSDYKGLHRYKNYFKNVFVNYPKKVSYNKTENECRKILEKIYHKKFPSTRPDFLRNPITKKNLELDCYNPELKLALEYNGKQHYTYTPYFHKSKRNFYSQVHRDDWKRKRCKMLGINLIEVPYWVSLIDLEDYIIKELKKKSML